MISHIFSHVQGNEKALCIFSQLFPHIMAWEKIEKISHNFSHGKCGKVREICGKNCEKVDRVLPQTYSLEKSRESFPMIFFMGKATGNLKSNCHARERDKVFPQFFIGKAVGNLKSNCHVD